MKRRRAFRCIEEILVNSWWLVFSLLIGCFIYDRAMQKLLVEEERLRGRVVSLNQKIDKEGQRQEFFLSYIHHWDSPKVVEKALIYRFGLVPKGYVKVCLPNTASSATLPDSQ